MSETPISTETPSSPLVTVTSTVDPSRTHCFTKPVAVLSEGLPNTPQAQEIIQTILKSYEIVAEATHTSDASKFSTVFINDPRFPVPPGTLETVRRLSHNPTLQSAGWLDYRLAYFTAMREEKVPLLTKEALRTPESARTALPDLVWCDSSWELIFESININTDTATVVLKYCETFELTLVLVDSHWFIAAHETLSRCYP